MKSEFQILKNRPKIQIVLDRDSVCAGDDGESHEEIAEVYAFVDPEIFVREISTAYLPAISGIGHSWTCELNGVKIAELSHSGISVTVRECPFSEVNRVYFTYHAASY